MSESLSRIPKGFRYYSANEALTRRAMEKIAQEVFEGWSYEEIVIPTVDYYSLFAQGIGVVQAQRSFRFTDSDGQMLALRPDITSSIARAAVTLFATRPRPLRLCYGATVFHQQVQSAADWRRETKQIGCELLGRNSTVADLEILVIAMELLRRWELNRCFVITLSDVQIFAGIVENLGLSSEARDELRRLVDIRAVTELERFLISYATPVEAAAFADLIQLSGKGEIFEKARRVITNARSLAALARLEHLWDVIESLGLSSHFEIDLGDVSSLEYYTGLTLKIYVDGLGSKVGGGGRYDNLTARFGRAEPAIGFVLELDPLAELIADKQQVIVPAERETVICKSEGDEVAALFQAALKQRAANQRVIIG